MTALTGVALSILVLNVPFGYWRANVERLGFQWFLAVHAPVPLVVACRLAAGIHLSLVTLPVLLAVYFSGQYAGSRIYAFRRGHGHAPRTSCLVWDLIRTGRRA